MPHPHHDELVAAVREWYSGSYPEMGYVREPTRFGFYTRHARSPDLAQATVRRLEPAETPELLDDLRDYFSGRPVTIYIDDRRLDVRLVRACSRPAVRLVPSRATSLTSDQYERHLSHTG